VLRKLEQALLHDEVFVAAALPKRLVRLLVSRYEPGVTYGTHVDDALMEVARTNLSFTLLLSDPDTYEGGALVIEDTYGERTVRLPAGELILYPSTTLHRVDPVISGVRLAAVGWVRSYVRDPECREILFDLETALRQMPSMASRAFSTRWSRRGRILYGNGLRTKAGRASRHVPRLIHAGPPAAGSGDLAQPQSVSWHRHGYPPAASHATASCSPCDCCGSASKTSAG